MSRGAERPVTRKFAELITFLRLAGSGVLAFSGGVDSSLLLKAMQVSGMRFLAVTSSSETMPEKELQRAVAFAKEMGVEHLVIQSSALSNEAFVSNPPERCFFCKEELFKTLRQLAEEKKYKHIFDGTNSDDLRDYRPGLKAAAIYGVRSPLAESGLSKEDVRRMSEELGLSNWDRPSSPCLSSRFPYGRRITPAGLRQVEKAEELLRELGLGDVRVRNHGEIARIEVDEKDMHFFLAPGNRRKITEGLKSLGFSFVSLDLEGYVCGSLNRPLKEDKTLKTAASN